MMEWERNRIEPNKHISGTVSLSPSHVSVAIKVYAGDMNYDKTWPKTWTQLSWHRDATVISDVMVARAHN